MKYRKKPVVIEAMQWKGMLDNFDDKAKVTEWINYMDNFEGWYMKNTDQPAIFQGDKMVLPTLEGEMKANPGDWIIIGVNGEAYPCKPDIFEKTYEPVVEQKTPSEVLGPQDKGVHIPMNLGWDLK
jgi:hypothetical protein